jgi:ribosomal protein S6--L-glutamate ligase
MRIAVITAPGKSDRRGSVMTEAGELLTAQGASVETICPEEALLDLAQFRVAHDLYLLKSGTEAGLAFAGSLDLAGARLLNPYAATVLMKDKILVTRALAAAGVPLPATYAAAEPGQLLPLLADGPLVVKPYRGGSQGRGVRIVRGADELAGLAPDQGLLFAQRYHQPDGRDHKIYAIGGRYFGVRRVWPPRSYEDKLGEPFELTAELAEISDRCGRACGVDLFGLDVVISEGRLYVVDINTFPGFKGVPEAARLLADYIEGSER